MHFPGLEPGSRIEKGSLGVHTHWAVERVCRKAGKGLQKVEGRKLCMVAGGSHPIHLESWLGTGRVCM